MPPSTGHLQGSLRAKVILLPSLNKLGEIISHIQGLVRQLTDTRRTRRTGLMAGTLSH